MSSESPDLSRNDEWTVVTAQLVNDEEPEKQAVEAKGELDSLDTKPDEDSHKICEADEKATETNTDESSSHPLPNENKKPQENKESAGNSNSTEDLERKPEEEKNDDEEKEAVKEIVKDIITKKLEDVADTVGESLIARVEEIRDDVSDISSVTDIISPETSNRISPLLHWYNVVSERVNLLLTVAAVLGITAVLGLGIVNLVGQTTLDDVEIPSNQEKHLKHEKSHIHQYHKKTDYKDYPLDDDLLKKARFLHRQLIMCNKQPNHKAC